MSKWYLGPERDWWIWPCVVEAKDEYEAVRIGVGMYEKARREYEKKWPLDVWEVYPGLVVKMWHESCRE